MNTDSGHDGIVLGGLRMAEDAQRIVAENDSLNAISLLGIWLGGLYFWDATAKQYKEEQVWLRAKFDNDL